MAAATGIWNHNVAAGQALASSSATPMDSTSSGTSGTTGDSSTISANDFLTLLVTEMQNQDPTANTDPNEYINQLVNVNSLEQLISINQTITTALGGSNSSSSSTQATGQTAGAPAGLTGTSSAVPAAQLRVAAHNQGSALASAPSSASGAAAAGTAAASAAGVKQAPGNLSIPGASAASQRVAQALSGRFHAR